MNAGELSVERFGECWIDTQAAMLGDAVELSPGYRNWWSYIPHFIGTPGYVYAYAYGQLLALSVYRQYEEQGAAFVPAYLELLSRGRLRAARGARAHRRRRSRRPRLLGRRPGHHRRAARRGRGRGARGRADPRPLIPAAAPGRATAQKRASSAVELVEAHRPQAERVGVEGLEVEARAVPGPRRVPAAQPHPLADLVGDRLAGQPEIAVHLARHEVGREVAALDHERQRQLRRPALPRVVALVVGDAQLEVQADVDDDPDRSHRLGAQHAELEGRVVEVAELAHEPLRVQRPALGVPGVASHRPLEPVETLGQVADHADLEVMAGDALVVADAHLAPERERGCGPTSGTRCGRDG